MISSGGDFPVSVTVQGNHAYVLDALDGGALYGYAIGGDKLSPIGGSYRGLGLGTTAATAFTGTPGQATFSPDGKALLVTTKAATNAVDVFAVHADGTLSAAPAVKVHRRSFLPARLAWHVPRAFARAKVWSRQAGSSRSWDGSGSVDGTAVRAYAKGRRSKGPATATDPDAAWPRPP